MKTREWSPDRGFYTTDASFRSYDDPAESSADYWDFLNRNKRYKPVLQSQNLGQAVAAMGASGYATDPNYAGKLLTMRAANPAQSKFLQDRRQELIQAGAPAHLAELGARQSALETGWGKSLAGGRNYYGIKTHGRKRKRPDVRMASTGGVTTGSTNPMDVTGDPRTGAMDMPQPTGEPQVDSDYLHPAIQAILERQQQPQQPDLGNALLGMGMGILGAGGGPGAGNWFGEGVRGAAQMMSQGQPEKMTELQLLKANGELQALEIKAQERRDKRRSMQRLKQRYPEYAEAIDAGLMGKDAFAEVMGLGGEGAATYGKAGVPFQVGEFEDGTPKYGMMQLGDDGSYKMHELPPGYEPKWGPEQQAEITREKAKAKGLGEYEAEKIVEFPTVHSNVQRMVKTIDSLLDDPVGMNRAVGAISIFPTIPGGNAADYESRLAQLYGQNFLLAYQDLKGGGQITEIEGQKAEQALVALGTAQSVEEHRKALQDYRQAAIDGYKKLRAQAPKEVVDNYPDPFEPSETPKVRKYNPETGTLE